jgi:nucleoside-diphosphate-sugar epimerase
MNTQALVIGFSSMVGSELVRQLRALNVDVTTSARDGGDVSYDLAGLKSPPQLPTDEMAAVFICASSFAGDDPEGCVQNALVNTVAMYRLTEWAQRLQSRHVVLASSASANAPSSSYGLSKAQGEQVLEWCGEKHGFKTTMLQLPQLCDDHGLCARHQPWFARIVQRAATGQDLHLAPNDQPRNFLHVTDAARAMIASWRAELVGRHALTSPSFATYRDIADTAYQVFKKGGAVVEATEMKPFRPSPFPPASPAAWALLEDRYVSLRETFEHIKMLGTAVQYQTS